MTAVSLSAHSMFLIFFFWWGWGWGYQIYGKNTNERILIQFKEKLENDTY